MIVNNQKKYVGYVVLLEVLHQFFEASFLSEDSHSGVISKPHLDFSMIEIVQLVASNNSKVLGVFISKRTEKTTEITVQISSENLNEILSNHHDDRYLEELKNHANYFEKYLKCSFLAVYLFFVL